MIGSSSSEQDHLVDIWNDLFALVHGLVQRRDTLFFVVDQVSDLTNQKIDYSQKEAIPKMRNPVKKTDPGSKSQIIKIENLETKKSNVDTVFDLGVALLDLFMF